MLCIEQTTGWTSDRMLAALPSVLTCIRKVTEEFPDDTTETYIIERVMCNEQQLWAVFDDAAPNTVLLAVVTELKRNLATGKLFVECAVMGGERVHEALPIVVNTIEDWAAEQGAEQAKVLGRFGWAPTLRDYGYRKKAVLLTKPLTRSDANGHITE